MSSNSSRNIAAVIKDKGQPIVLEERPVPQPSGKGIVIRNRAIALNPADWKMQETGMFIKSFPTVIGSDVSGIIQAVGPDVKRFKPGDRVIGFASSIESGGDPDRAAFQTFTLSAEHLTMHLPDSLSFRQGAIFPMAVLTNAIALYGTLGLSRPSPASTGPSQLQQQVNSKHAILIWGGSSSVGANSIQMLKHLGFTVYATASPKHHDLLKSLGAAEVFDYNSPTAVKDILDYTNAHIPISMLYDTISLPPSLKPSLEIITGSIATTFIDGASPKRLVHTVPWMFDLEKPSGIDIAWVDYTKVDPVELCGWATEQYLEPLLADGTFVPAPTIKLFEGGLANLQAALEYGSAGKVSGEKLVLDVE